MSVEEGIRRLDGELIVLDDASIPALAAQIGGTLIRPGDPEYDSARRVWNGMIDKYPALIMRCAGTSDVVAGVNFAREHNLLLAVRGGGHNVAGNAVNDGGLVLDLSPMKGIQVDPEQRVARAQGGVIWGELDRATQQYGLATPGGQVSETGIAGYTLSGGLGYLQRKWGLACDNLRSVEIVTADGAVLRASETEHPDLFWAVRGGGGNFGVVTEFEFQLYPLGPEVFQVATIYPLEQAPQIIRKWQEFTKEAPNEIFSEIAFWGILPLPVIPAELHGQPMVATVRFYAGPADEGELALQPLREWGTPIIDLSGKMNYLDVQMIYDPVLPQGLYYYWKSLNFDEWDETLIDAVVELAYDRPTPETLFAIRHLRGAISERPDDATAYGNRQAGYNLSIDTTWHDPADNERMVAWTRQAWSDMRTLTGGGVYLNFAGLGEENDLLARAGYGVNYERMRAIKRRYDPTNLFRGNINVTPAT